MNPSPPSLDILGLGCVAVDELLYVPSFPAADEKMRVTWRERHGGGLAGTALVAAARLGARCAYAGQLGPDEASSFAAEIFRREGVDTSLAPIRSDARVISSTILVAEDTGSRTILYFADGRSGPADDEPAAAVIAASRVLFIDHYGVRGGLRAARIARGAGRAVVADFEAPDPSVLDGLMDWVDHLIVSRTFAERATGCADPAEAARRLWRPDRSAVVVTCGGAGCWAVSAEAPASPRHFPAFAVQAVDTTGCGDVFHGAYAAALARNEALDDRVRFAAAAAAIKAGRRGGQSGIPDRPAVLSFLAAQPPHSSPILP